MVQDFGKVILFSSLGECDFYQWYKLEKKQKAITLNKTKNGGKLTWENQTLNFNLYVTFSYGT